MTWNKGLGAGVVVLSTLQNIEIQAQIEKKHSFRKASYYTEAF